MSVSWTVCYKTTGFLLPKIRNLDNYGFFIRKYDQIFYDSPQGWGTIPVLVPRAFRTVCEKRVPEKRGGGCKLLQRRPQNRRVLNSVFFFLFSQQLSWWEGRNWGWFTFLQEPLILFWRTVTPMSWDDTKSSGRWYKKHIFSCPKCFVVPLQLCQH